ncbi:MAG: outer membrane protein assembly factor BamD [Candidatus Cloacimonetes bacterium]|nr:outer membrane protein assembly factor BamD [Candidatus Cloacimonadota bacterium]
MKMKALLIALIALFVLIGCSANKGLNTTPASEKWDKAETFYQKKKYEKAIPLYEQLVLERNSVYTADAQFKLAESYFYSKKYVEAVTEYQLLLSLFPDYKDISSAQFMIGVAYYKQGLNPHYTQDETNKSIDAFQVFIDKYPWDKRRSDAYDYIQKCQRKLLEKKYLAGYIYYKIDDYSSALLYLDEIIALNNKDELELKSLYYSGLIHYERHESDKLYEIQERLRQDFPESKELQKIIRKTVKLSKKMSKKGE